MKTIEFDTRTLGGLPITVCAAFCCDGELYDWWLLDHRGRRAKWAEKRLTESDEASIVEQAYANYEG